MFKRTCGILIFLILLTQLFGIAYAGVIDTDTIQYYIYDENLEKFVPDQEYIQNRSSFSSEIDEITIDGKKSFVVINSFELNEQLTSEMNYTGLNRIQSISNGQTSSVSEEFTDKEIHSISNIVKKNKNFSTGIKLLGGIFGNKSKKDANKTEVLNGEYSFQSSYSTTDKETEIESIMKRKTKNYSIPDDEMFDNCNAADFYIFRSYKIYDVEGEIYHEYETTDRNKGYVSVDDAIAVVGESNVNQWLECSKCGAIVKDYGSGGGEIPLSTGYRSDYHPYQNMYHVTFADGTLRHFSCADWDEVNNKIYFPYNEDSKTTVTFRYYKPVLMSVTLPWKFDYINDAGEINLNKPVELLPKGMEEIVCDSNKYYKFRLLESYLYDSNHAINLDIDTIDSLSKGVTEELELDEYLSTTIEHTEVNSSSSGYSAGLKLKFCSWLTGSANYSQKVTKIKEEYDSVTNTVHYNVIATYTMPQDYIDAGYDCTGFYVTEDTMRYKIKGEIIPLDEDGIMDLNNKTTIEYYQDIEFPRAYSLPEDVLPN